MTNSAKICIHNLIFDRIYSIIEDGRVKKSLKKESGIINKNKKLKYYTKEILKYFNITVIAFGFIIAIVLIKYKPIYKVSISGKEVGYLENKDAFNKSLKEGILNETDKNIESIDIKEEPEYELKLVERKQETNEEKIAEQMELEDNLTITYKYYEIACENNMVEKVNTLEEAEELVNQVKEENKEELDISIIEKYTQNEEEASTSDIEVAKTEIQGKITNVIAKKEEQERLDKMPEINGIKIAIQPISGKITSRYGVSSRIRRSNHTGLDIAAPKGTPVKVVADGTVISSKYEGSYGKLVKVNHGNGLETWYAHNSQLLVKPGQKVKAGDVISKVGSTGNSTGNHLHLEIRINGKHVNPQKYLYN